MTSTEPRFIVDPCIHGPYRQPMGVMFVDLDHFMGICIDVPPHDEFALIREFQRIVTDTVASFKGELNAYQGDGVLATFGNLDGRADCATRALRCAWEILEQVSGLNLGQTIGGGRSVSASIGLQYGQVWTGTIGISKRYGPTLIGDAVNVAARLEQKAHALGTKIVVGDELMQMAYRERASSASELARFVCSGPLSLHGRRTPINVWALQTRAVEFLSENSSTPPIVANPALRRDDRSGTILNGGHFAGTPPQFDPVIDNG
jgi:adenylate cyclase